MSIVLGARVEPVPRGISISLACEDDAFMLPDIEVLLGEKLVCERPPEQLSGS